MIKREVKIKGETYTVRATTPRGVEEGIKALKASLKRLNKKDNEEDAI